eukprot:2186668-Rhodomonas_salina.6
MAALGPGSARLCTIMISNSKLQLEGQAIMLTITDALGQWATSICLITKLELQRVCNARRRLARRQRNARRRALGASAPCVRARPCLSLAVAGCRGPAAAWAGPWCCFEAQLEGVGLHSLHKPASAAGGRGGRLRARLRARLCSTESAPIASELRRGVLSLRLMLSAERGGVPREGADCASDPA